MKRVGGFLFLCLIMLSLVTLLSCKYNIEDAKKYLPGQYFYEVRTGEYQTLKVNPNFTFKQIVYAKNRTDILYENIGKMHVDGDKLEFENWLECYDFANEKMLQSPKTKYLMGNYWRKPSGNEDTQIILYYETDYIFKKRQ